MTSSNRASSATLEIRSPRSPRSPRGSSRSVDVDIVVKVPPSPQADLKRQYKNLLTEIEETKPKLRQLEVLQSEVGTYLDIMSVVSDRY